MELLASHQRKLDAMQNAMPNRPLTLKHTGESLFNQILYIIVGLGLFLLVSSIVATGMGEILEDRKIASNPVDVPTAVVSGSCKGGKIPFLKGCDVTISNAGTTVKHEFSYFGLSANDNDANVVAQKDNPKNMNITLATEHIMNRIFTTLAWLVLGLMGLFLAYSNYKSIPVTQRLKKLFNTPAHQPWELVALPVKSSFDVNLEYNNTIDGNPKKMEFGYDDKNKKPFWLGNNKDLVVALKAKDTQTVIPILQSLDNIDLKKDEKQALLRAYTLFDVPDTIRQS